ncbi:MAG TPA: hypothetical protein VGL53_10755 [Bryobacteraceae bacterium]|jgi:threonine/homoserine/homoserine lactone efflux protein
MFKLAKSFVLTVMPSVLKPLHILWNEIIGFIFIVFAIGTVPAGLRYYRAMAADPTANGFRLAVTVFFGATMTYFGITSFLRARRIRRLAEQRPVSSY